MKIASYSILQIKTTIKFIAKRISEYYVNDKSYPNKTANVFFKFEF